MSNVRLRTRLAAAMIATVGLAGAALVAGAPAASANTYTSVCSDGVCGLYRNGSQIGIYNQATGRTVWFQAL